MGMMTLGVILGYFLLWSPFITHRNELKNIISSQQDTLRWLQEAAAEVQQLRYSSDTFPVKNRTQSLLSLIDKSTRQGALSKTSKRIVPKGEEVRVNFEQVSFTELMRWLEQLYNQYQVQVHTINLERLPVPDQVKVQMTLK